MYKLDVRGIFETEKPKTKPQESIFTFWYTVWKTKGTSNPLGSWSANSGEYSGMNIKKEWKRTDYHELLWNKIHKESAYPEYCQTHGKGAAGPPPKDRRDNFKLSDQQISVFLIRVYWKIISFLILFRFIFDFSLKNFVACWNFAFTSVHDFQN